MPGFINQGVTFGNGGYIDIPDNGSLDNQTLTLAAWAKPSGAGPNNDQDGSIIIGKGLSPANGGQTTVTVQLAWRATDNRFLFLFGDVNTEIITSTHTFAPGQFYYVAGTYDGSTFKLYVNGALEGSFTETKTLTYDGSIPWTIGSTPAWARGVGFPRTWNGVIDEARIYNRALSADEIAASYGGGVYHQTGGTTTVLGSLAVAGGGIVALDGGTLTGTGSVGASVVNAGGQVAPGPASGGIGILSITGSYTQQSAARSTSISAAAPPARSTTSSTSPARSPSAAPSTSTGPATTSRPAWPSSRSSASARSAATSPPATASTPAADRSSTSSSRPPTSTSSPTLRS